MVLVWIVVLAIAFVVALRIVIPRFVDSPGATTQEVATSRTTFGPAPAIGPMPATQPASVPTPPSITSRAEHVSPIYRCGDTYGQTPCAGARTVDGPAASGFDSRPSETLERLVAAGRVAQADTVTQNSVALNGPGSARVPECQDLAAQVEAIDRTTRQPLSKPAQDQLRGQRQNARDRQARLHC